MNKKELISPTTKRPYTNSSDLDRMRPSFVPERLETVDICQTKLSLFTWSRGKMPANKHSESLTLKVWGSFSNRPIEIHHCSEVS